MIVFSAEKYQDAIEEIKPFYEAHYNELASNKEISLNPDYDAYDRMAERGYLHVIVARLGGVLVGYHIIYVEHALHYKHSLTAHTDIYYLRPDCRKGFNGVNFFKFAEQYLRSIGVQRFYTMTKTDSDKGLILERLGFVEKERMYTKMLR